MIRVLHVVSSLGTGSGVMSVLMNYHRVIDKEKVQFDYLAFKNVEKSHEEEIKAMGGRVYYCSRPAFGSSFSKEIKVFFEEHVKEYSILHCHPVFGAFFWGRHARKAGFTHVIQHSHLTQFSNRKSAAIRNRLLLSMSKGAITEYMACSEAAKGIFSWKKKEEVYFLPNAIRCEKFQFSQKVRECAREKLGILEDEILVGHVGRFQKEKNHAFLLEVFDKIHEMNANTKLLLIGDGPLFEEIVERAKQMELSDRCMFLGRRSDVHELLQAMDVMVFPSFVEGLPVTMVEAQTAGLACVMSDLIPEQSVITNGLVDILSLEQDAKEWADAALLAAKKERRDRMDEIRSSGYNITDTAKWLEDFYQTL